LRIIPLIRERLKKLGDFDEWTAFFFAEPAIDRAAFAAAKKMSEADVRDALALQLDLLGAVERFDKDALEARLKDAAAGRGWKVGDFLMCLRLAITGKTATPPLLESMEILGREACIGRVRAAVAALGA
jgi:glutamyl-tRNA synthetase